MPDLDPGAWANALIGALMSAYPALIEAATNALAGQVEKTSTPLIDQINDAVLHSPLNFVTRTPPELTYNMGGVTDLYTDWRTATAGVFTLAVVCGGLASVGREMFGWHFALPTWTGRQFIGMVLVLSMPFVYATSIGLLNMICDAVVMADIPSVRGFDLDPITQSIMVIVWIVLGVRLLIRMAYRLIYLAVLMAVGPLAAYCVVVPGAEDFWQSWLQAYVGMCVGQFLVVLCLKLAAVVTANGLGGTLGGLAVSVAVLLLAYDLATFAAPIKGGGLSGVLKQAGAAVALIL